MKPPQLSKVLRCRECRFYGKGTITTFPLCKKNHEKRHGMNKTCKDFEPKPVPVKKDIKIATFDILGLK